TMSDLQLIYLETPPEHIAYAKFIFESYEEVGIIRTIDRKRAVIVLLVMRDFAATARKILDSLEKEIPLKEIAPTAATADDWFMSELAVGLPDETKMD
ncbi:MAG: DUF4911 domain-containing protein, partial [Candidatus Binatia bacterium]